MTGWFRSYADKLDNPKVQRLSDALYRAWDSLLCVACRHDGVLPPLADLAFLLRRSPAATAKLIDALMQADLLVKTERGIEPHDWNEWQYKSDTSQERMRRHRQRQRDVTSAVTATPSESESESESDREALQGFPILIIKHLLPLPRARAWRALRTTANGELSLQSNGCRHDAKRCCTPAAARDAAAAPDFDMQ